MKRQSADERNTEKNEKMTATTIEVSAKGEWIKVPALNVDGNSIVVTGKWIKTASIHDEIWLEKGVEDPDLCIKMLKSSTSQGLQADVFTFTQKLPLTAPKYSYPL